MRRVSRPRRRALRPVQGRMDFPSPDELIEKPQDEEQPSSSINSITVVLQVLIRIGVPLLVSAPAFFVVKISVEQLVAIVSVAAPLLFVEIRQATTNKDRHLRLIIELKLLLLDIIRTILSLIASFYLPFGLIGIACIWGAPIVVSHALYRRRRRALR
jgi:hypothetical protein